MLRARICFFACGFLAAATLSGQTCPAINFLHASEFRLFAFNQFASGFQRQANGSFTQYSYQANSPYTKTGSTTSAELPFVSCTGTPARTPTPPSGWNPLAVTPGVSSLAQLALDLAGNGSIFMVGVPNKGQYVNQLVVAASDAAKNLQSSATYAVGQNPSSIVAGDFNGDGKIDVAVVNVGSPGSISVLLGNGDGTFKPATTYNTPALAFNATAIDLNGDGRSDLAVVGGSGATNNVSVFIANSDGTMKSPVNYPVSSTPFAVAAADINSDSKPDLLVVTGTSNLSVLLGNGGGTFQPATELDINGLASNLATGDFDKDGKIDIALSGGGQTITVLFGAGNGTFPRSTRFLQGISGGRVIAMDFDWDGNLDIVVAAGHPDILTPSANYPTIAVMFGRGDGTFISASSYRIGSTLGNTRQVGGFGFADYTGDSKLDLLAAHRSDGKVYVYSGQGSDKFQPLSTTTVFNTATFSAVATGDFNKDGKSDVAVSDDTNNKIWLLSGKGDGTFNTPTSVSLTSAPSWVATADLNADNKPDLVASTANGVSVLLGNGDGTFPTQSNLTTGTAPAHVVIADLNADGKPDLIVSNQADPNNTNSTGNVSVLLGTGAGAFQPAVNYTAGKNPMFTAVADVNGDGKQDLLTVTKTSSTTWAIAFLAGKGDGTFQPAVLVSTSVAATSVVVADFNGDGKKDLVVTHCCGSTDMTFLLGNGDGTFQADQHFNAGSQPYLAMSLDLNGDGKPDLVVSNGDQAPMGLVHVLLNISVVPPASPTITSPTPGITFSAGSVTFNWTTVTGATKYRLDIGSSGGGGDIFSQETTGTSLTVSNLPTDGRSLFVQIAAFASGVFGAPSSYTYKAVTQFALSVTRNGTGAGTVTGGAINCGTTCSANLDSGTVVVLTATPSQGSTFAAWSGACSGAASCNVTMDAAKSVTATFNIIPPASPTITSPTPGITFSAGSVTFNWTAVAGATKYRLDIGSSGGGSDIFSQETTGTSLTVSTLPTDGRSLFVQIAAFASGAFGTPSTYTYTAFTSPITSLRFVPVVPCRVMDTRGANGPLGGPFIAGGATRLVPVQSSTCGIPANAAAYSLNITVVPKTGTLGFLTVWPAGVTQPGVSTLNAPDGSILANAAIVPAGTSGSINAFALNDTDLIIDINGYFIPPAAGALQFFPVTPCRVLDTRGANGTFGGPAITGGTSRSFPIPSSPCNVPATAAAYSFNVTVVPQGFLGFLTAWPTGTAQPNVSTLNSLDGTVLANAAIVPAGTGGAVSFFANNTTNLVVDVNGYFAPPGTGGLNFNTVTPCRVVDTRGATGPLGGPIMNGGTSRTFPLPGACGLPSTAAAYSLNMTVVPSGPLGFLTTWPAGLTQPGSSTLNAPKGIVVANAALVPAGTSGGVNVFVLNTTQVIIDTNGYFGQ